jgi:uncharacterized protein (DUF2252 family)
MRPEVWTLRVVAMGGVTIQPEKENTMAMDVVQQIRTFNVGRDPERLALKYQKMRISAFSFLRGSCHLFYARLPKSSIFKSAPFVWVCGDLHLENFGSYKGDNRLVYFDINDFDESALAPASWDLVRMLTSIEIGAQEAGVKPVEAKVLCSQFLESYASVLRLGKAYWLERDTAQGPVHTLLSKLRHCTRPEFLNTRTEILGKKRIIRLDGKKALPVNRAQREAVMSFMTSFAQTRHEPGFFRVLDIARRIAGTGSLGLERYAILVKGRGSPDENQLLDLKLATPSSLAPYLTARQPKWASEASRVVALQQRIQAVPMAFLQAVHAGKSSFVLRGLQPSEDRIIIAAGKLKQTEFRQMMDSLGKLVAWAHLRSASRQGAAGADELIDYGQRMKWQIKLLVFARACSHQVRADTATFNAAFDDGAFGGG